MYQNMILKGTSWAGPRHSYGLIFNPRSDNLVDNSLYRNRELYIIPYMAFRILIYSTFLPFSYVMFLYFGFTSHIISTNLTSNFMRTNFSSGSGAWRYDPRTSNFCNSLASWTSIINYAYSASITMFGDVAPS